jgi:hypothetical protein
MNNPKLSILLQRFTHNTASAVRYISGRALSLAELGAIREQCAAVLRSAFLAGMVEKNNKLLANFEPWDEDNDPTDPFIPRTPKKEDAK